ncbi:MAG: ABC transporter substrate-binding protein, partial [Mesorhizobium sp.]
MTLKSIFAAAVALAALMPLTPGARAETVTDIAGRKVEVKTPVEKVILGEGRQIYLIAALDTGNPFK